MKQGKSLVELAQELQRVQAKKKDYVVSLGAMEMTEKAELQVTNGEVHSYKPTNWAHQQIASYADIPKTYYDRMLAENDTKLIQTNVNHWFKKFQSDAQKSGRKESRLVRTYEGKARAFLSSRYRILDSHDLLETVLPAFLENDMQVISSELTERRLFLKALSPKVETEVKKGDVVQYGLTISSSDVGCGSVRVEPLIYRLSCLNGLIMPDSSVRKFHIGKDLSIEGVRELMSDEAKETEDRAFWLTVRDVVLNSMKREVFEAAVDRLRIAADMPIKSNDLNRVIELTTKAVGITGEENKKSILSHLASGGDLSQWGLINAVTRAAHDDHVEYEESVEMERSAGKILELSKDQWKVIAATA